MAELIVDGLELGELGRPEGDRLGSGRHRLRGAVGESLPFAAGVSQSVPFGAQAIAFGPIRLAELETVNDHFGRKVWRWRLATSRLKTTSRSDDGVALKAGGVPAGFRIPVSGSGIARA